MTSNLPGSGMAPDDGPTASKLRAYVDANAGRFTDAVITAELVKAGYDPDAISAALAQAASREQGTSQTGRAVKTILILYAATFALLSLGMLLNTYRAQYAPDAIGGIVILAGSLGFALLLAFAWVGNRRAAALIFALLLGLFGVGTLGSGNVGGFLLLATAIALLVLVYRRGSVPTTRSTATLAALLSVPVILLVIVAGLCIATGLPIPRAG